MVRLATVVSWVGVLTGAWVLVAVYALGERWSWVTPALAVILVLASAVSMVGPRRAFYGTAAVALLLAVSTALGSAHDTVEAATLGLGAALFALAIIAARREGRVSEQSHPMNLPVFG